MARNGWKRGLWLVLDEESGFERYSNEVVYDEYGKLVKRKYADRVNPQEYLPGLRGPTPAGYGRASDPPPTVSLVEPEFVGNTSVPTKQAPLSHLFTIQAQNDAGISEMTIDGSDDETAFIVR